MATTQTGPNLAPAERALENLMDDECQVWRDTTDVDDIESGTLDPVTFEITTPAPHLVYDGRCKISTVGPASTTRFQGDVNDIQDDEFWFSMPLSYLRLHPESEPKRGDRVSIVGSRRDASFVGTNYIIRRVIRKTLQASRRCVVVEATLTEASL